jgi:hypothetical protein
VRRKGLLWRIVEFDPVSARPLVERAVKERGEGKSACNRSIFQDISIYATDPILTDIALETLDDPDPEVTMDALIYLMSYGDKSVEQPVWSRYVEWSDKWRIAQMCWSRVKRVRSETGNSELANHA